MSNQPSHKQRFIKNSIFSIAFALIIYIGLILWSNGYDLWAVIITVPKQIIGLVLGMILLSYWLRFLKWQHYLHRLQIKIGWFDSLRIYLAGFALTITPGKVGEVIRSYLLKRVTGTSISKTAPIIISDRLTDVIALVTIISVGALNFNYGKWFALVALLGVTCFIIVLAQRRLMMWLLEQLSRIPRLNILSQKGEQVYTSISTLNHWPSLAFTTVLSLGAWLLESLAFYFLVQSIGGDITIFANIFMYSFATLIGAVSFLPGGIGLMESTLTGLQLLFAVEKAAAAGATLLIRFATLWFAVLIGVVSLIACERKFHVKFKQPTRTE